MQFFSLTFFIFLFLLLVVLRLPLRRDFKKYLLTFASCAFYAAWDFRYLILLGLVSGIDYIAAAKIASVDDNNAVRKRWVIGSVASNLGILGYFKYANFFLDNLNFLGEYLAFHLPMVTILLPAGISFYTFKSMSYTIDVYRREIRPCDRFIDYVMFVTFFPDLIAGPIVRASIFLPQLDKAQKINLARVASGLSVFLLGFTKKRLFADNIANYVDPIFADPNVYSTGTLWFAAVAYALQIYTDFSGYSDMAIGTARMLGYELPRNFNTPYFSRSLSEFWRRWHITLSSWLRDYLYIPLGGNRKGKLRTSTNLMITMLLGGLWHGASWNFVIWGALHGGGLIIEKLKTRHVSFIKIPWAISTIITFSFVTLSWVPFRAQSLDVALTIWRKMAVPTPGATFISTKISLLLSICALAHLAGFNLDHQNDWQRRLTARLLAITGFKQEHFELSGWSLRLSYKTFTGSFILSCWILMLYYFSAVSSSPFIYFQF